MKISLSPIMLSVYNKTDSHEIFSNMYKRTMLLE